MLKELYKIKITQKGIVPTTNFHENTKNGTHFKIYIAKHKKDFIYVGVAKQSIQARFAGAFRAYAKKKETGKSEYGGYSGYKWIEKFQASGEELDLFVFSFKLGYNKIFIEAIEAELVFIIRTETRMWPLGQHEIHFHNIDEAKKIAQDVYKEIK